LDIGYGGMLAIEMTGDVVVEFVRALETGSRHRYPQLLLLEAQLAGVRRFLSYASYLPFLIAPTVSHH
jgi:hypothetical protein